MRLVDADALMESLKESADRAEQTVVTFNECGMRIKDAPTVDAVEVVRCKDCKYWRRDTDHTCKEHSLVSPMLADGFCSRGKRKDGDNVQTD